MEKYNVLWEGYNDHLRQMLHSMMKFDEFTDVTLVSDDLQEIQAHRVVLSACSPVLKNMLQKRNGGVPVVYMKGIKFIVLEEEKSFLCQFSALVAICKVTRNFTYENKFILHRKQQKRGEQVI